MIYKIVEINRKMCTIMIDRKNGGKNKGCRDCNAIGYPAMLTYDTKKERFQCYNKGYRLQYRITKKDNTKKISINLLTKLVARERKEKFRNFLKKILKERL